jgi:Mn-dependent DtxR family transcriptional regulator
VLAEIRYKKKEMYVVRRQKGPLPRFAETHLQMALDLIAARGRVGRKHLAEKLDIGEGSMRAILNRLKKRGLITSSRGGHSLTTKGKRVLGKPFRFVRVDAGSLTVGKVDVATIVRGAAEKIKRGIEQRDEAIKAGADGATVLVFKRGGFRFPDEFLKVEEKLNDVLTEIFDPREGDVVIIGTSMSPIRAEDGARAAARSLTRKFERR